MTKHRDTPDPRQESDFKNWAFVTLTLLASLFSCGIRAANSAVPQGFNGARGLWYDRQHSGHGFDVEQQGDLYLVLFYTYDAQGEPEWYAAQDHIVDGVMNTRLLHFRYDRVQHRQVQDAVAGHFLLEYGAAAGSTPCDGIDRSSAPELARVRLDIGGQAIDWCLEPLVPAMVQPETAMSGIWWGGDADSGWGLASYFIHRDSGIQSVHLSYYYDGNDRPRWSYAEANGNDFLVDTRWQSYRGFCRSCSAVPLVGRDAGRLSLSLVTPLIADGLANRIDSDLVYPAGIGGSWNRHGELKRFADPPRPYGGTVLTREGIVAPDIFLDDSHRKIYYGIPYAAPPTGALRWRAPQPATPRTRVLDVNAVPPGCPQTLGQSLFGGAPAATSEDCLYLNVWVPQPAASQPLPVMVWIHGGGLIQGSAVDVLPPAGIPVYAGDNFSVRNVVFVSIDYRLGPLGFLAHPAFFGEHGDYPATGNYGFLDQVAALRWVRDNIAQFGGDPNQVTIFGESAGGKSVCAHYASPLSRGLFQRGIMESGACAKTLARLSTRNGNAEAAFDQGARVAARLGCDTASDVAACLRGKSADAVIAAGMATVGFGRTGEQYDFRIDEIAFDRAPGTAIADGSAAAVPMILGTNNDEASSLISDAQRVTTVAGYEALVRSTFPNATVQAAVLQRYPAADYTPVWRAWAAIVSDTGFICPAQRIARDHAAYAPTYAYYFTQTQASRPDLGSFHGLEIGYLFNLLAFPNGADNLLADRMRDDWTRFARSGTPSADGQVAWPTHPRTGTRGLELNAGADVVRDDYRQAYCAFWAQFVDL